MLWLRSLPLLLLACAPAAAGDWPQWLGPNRDNSSPEKVTPWQQKPPVLWRQPAGEGHSSPVVADGRVFLHSRVKDRNEEEVAAFDAKSGKELWRKTYPRAAFTSLYGNGPRATPAVVGGKVYTFGITGILTCWEAASGDKVWQVDTLKQFQAKNLFFGMACSPLVVDGRVLLNVGGKGASVVALDAGSGAVAWKGLDDPASYSSPVVFGKGKERQVVFLTGANLVSLDPADGSVFWKFPLQDKLLESSTTPVRVGDLVLASSITYGSAALELGTKDGKPTASVKWKNPALTSYFSTPVAVGTKQVYMVTGKTPSPFTKPEAALCCVEAQAGKELWQKARVGEYHASLLRTGDNKLLMLSDGGDLVLLDPSPRGYRELARSNVSGPETWAHPALSDGRLYVRDKKELICLQLTK
jgi:outer membrane protein assembly factor BamB